MRFTAYHNASSIEEALQLLATNGERARIIAGGTDLMLELERGARPDVDVLVDISRVAGLDRIDESDADGLIHLGPTVTHNQVVASKLLGRVATPLVLASWEVGSPQIRNRGTVAGNVVTGSPANDTIPALWVLEAAVTLRSANGSRVVPIRDFYRGVRRTAMRADEMLIDISFKPLDDDSRSTFVKLGLRKAQAISVVNAALCVTMDGANVDSAIISLGSVAPTVIEAQAAQESLVGSRLTTDVIDRAAELAAEAATPIDDIRGSAWYRKLMIKLMIKRALETIADGKQDSSIPDQPIMLWGETEGKFTPLMAEQNPIGPDGVVSATVNGAVVSRPGAGKSLLRWLREELNLIGSKEGCAEGECGACTVFIDGIAVLACLVPAARADGAQVTTIEGIASVGSGEDGSTGDLTKIQQAFVDHGAVQCGYCTPGFVMAGEKIIEEVEQASREEIMLALSGNLCRCTGYYKIISAVEESLSMDGSLRR